MSKEKEILNAVSRHRARNRELRKVLIDRKIRLKEERPIDLHFWAKGQIRGALLASELHRRGFLVTCLAPAPSEQGQEDESWNLEARANLTPEKALSEEFTEDLVRTAAAFDSAYDGWGTSVSLKARNR